MDAAPACEPTPVKSNQVVGLSFPAPGTLCVWWEPAREPVDGYRIKLAFAYSGIAAAYSVGGHETTLLVDLGTIAVPPDQDRERALKDIGIQVWTLFDSSQQLHGGAALQVQ